MALVSPPDPVHDDVGRSVLYRFAEPVDCRHAHRSRRSQQRQSACLRLEHARPAGFPQQWYVEQHDVVGVRLLGDPPLDLLVHPRVHDRAQRSERIGVAEDDVRHRLAVERSVTGDDSLPEAFTHLGEHDGSGLLEFVHDRVGVDEDRPAVDQPCRDRGLPRPDASGQADENHG